MVQTRKVHILLAVEYDGSGEPAVLAVAHTEGKVLRMKEMVEAGVPSRKLLVLSAPIMDWDAGDERDAEAWLRSVGASPQVPGVKFLGDLMTFRHLPDRRWVLVSQDWVKELGDIIKDRSDVNGVLFDVRHHLSKLDGSNPTKTQGPIPAL